MCGSQVLTQTLSHTDTLKATLGRHFLLRYLMTFNTGDILNLSIILQQ